MTELLNEDVEQTDELALPAALPVLPLKETVVFPGARTLALVTVKNGGGAPPGWDDLYEIGTAAVVHKMIRVPDGTLRILVQGAKRIRLSRRTKDEPYLIGEFAEVPDEVEEN